MRTTFLTPHKSRLFPISATTAERTRRRRHHHHHRIKSCRSSRRSTSRVRSSTRRATTTLKTTRITTIIITTTTSPRTRVRQPPKRSELSSHLGEPRGEFQNLCVFREPDDDVRVQKLPDEETPGRTESRDFRRRRKRRRKRKRKKKRSARRTPPAKEQKATDDGMSDGKKLEIEKYALTQTLAGAKSRFEAERVATKHTEAMQRVRARRSKRRTRP